MHADARPQGTVYLVFLDSRAPICAPGHTYKFQRPGTLPGLRTYFVQWRLDPLRFSDMADINQSGHVYTACDARITPPARPAEAPRRGHRSGRAWYRLQASLDH